MSWRGSGSDSGEGLVVVLESVLEVLERSRRLWRDLKGGSGEGVEVVLKRRG